MNRNEINFPFRRYQIQPVWRADRPQKGRYREFYQCDADVVGTSSLICEAEIILMIKEVFKGLGIQAYTIKINHRGVLNGIADVIGAKGNEVPMFVAIDKLDKIGEEKVKEELLAKNFSEKSLSSLFDLLNVKGSNKNKLGFLFTRFENSPSGQKGLHDLEEVFELLESYGATDEHVEFDVALARGLSYYTGCIFEVKINNVSIGSVSGGGRYDNLTQAFGDKENLSGVGFSFGVDRLFDAMEELDVFPKDTQVSSKVLLCHFDDASFRYGLGVLSKLREAGIASEIYPDQAKLKKQLEFANKKMIPFTVVIGSDEMNSGEMAFKDMEKGEQQKLTVDEIVRKLKS
jgi:histidyl-tRNA synthetase